MVQLFTDMPTGDIDAVIIIVSMLETTITIVAYQYEAALTEFLAIMV